MSAPYQIRHNPRRNFAEYDIRIPLPDGSVFRERKRIPVSGKTAQERWVSQRYQALLRSQLKPKAAPQVPTYADFWDRFWRDHVEAEKLESATRCTYTSSHSTWLLPRFEKMRLDEIDTEHVQALKRTMLEAGRKAPTINNAVRLLSCVLNRAHDWRVIPFVRADFETLRVQRDLPVFYEANEVDALIKGATQLGTQYLVLVLLGIDAGLRRGELIALERTRVSLPRNQIEVARSQFRGELPKATKGHRVRKVPMTPRLRAAIEAYFAETSGRRVLLSPTGGAASEYYVRKWTGEIVDSAGLPTSRKVHILRHSFCTLLSAKGAPPRAIQALAGHASITTTERYTHLVSGAAEQAIALLQS